MSSIVERVLNSEFANGYEPCAEQTLLIDELVRSFNSADYCELLYSGVSEKYDPHKLASFLSMLIWQTSDNGAEISATLEKWAVSDCPFKVAVAHSDEIEVLLKNVNKRIKS